MDQDTFLRIIADYGLIIVVVMAAWGVVLGVRERVDPGSTLGRVLRSRPRPGQAADPKGEGKSTSGRAEPPEA